MLGLGAHAVGRIGVCARCRRGAKGADVCHYNQHTTNQPEKTSHTDNKSVTRDWTSTSHSLTQPLVSFHTDTRKHSHSNVGALTCHSKLPWPPVVQFSMPSHVPA